ncbi:Small hypothetical protein Hyp1 |uniref:Protoporphyrinogen oxidase n=1 Tax=Microbacterium esteraromaticum TaxID=57043 RepID=A0A1R4K4V3_9MICO|nr:hypothetical protein [Microbacterium esteraromaticum]SJN39347.1 Small hypothetical protein Hyp1 \
MKGKIGLVVGLGAGYVLGTRAGRARYEQIKTQWLKVWHLDPVQHQVVRVQDFAKAQAAAVPGALWNGAVKVVKAAANSTGAPGERLETAVDATKDAAGDVADAVKDAAKDAAESTAATNSASTGSSSNSATTKKPAAKTASSSSKTASKASSKSTPKKSGA